MENVLYLGAACLIGLMFVILVLHKGDSKKELLQESYIRDRALPYKRELAKKRTQLLMKDGYGDVDDRKWRKELAVFANRKIGPIPGELITSQGAVLSVDEVVDIIDAIAISGQKELDDLFSYSDDLDGFEYEHYCAKLLREFGWEANVSQASNDQGADIIAGRRGVTVAIQCKKYSKPVGNKAVQEVSASKLHYGTDYAAVVTNHSFTKSAKQLANSAKVILLHHSELEQLENLL